MKLNFVPSEFNITGKAIPEDVADKLLKWHICPMQDVRDELGYSIWASQESGYRPVSWEKSHGRSGNSQHTFKGKGAVDWTCKNFNDNKKEFLKSIIRHTDYTRIAIYNSFIHCDYKQTISGQREIYDSTPDSKWSLNKYI